MTEPGDATRFEALVSDHHGEIHRYLRRVTARASEADDLSQETFLRAYRAWAGVPLDANHRAWLYTIATNVFRNHVRSESRRRNAHDTVRATRAEASFDDPESEVVAGQIGALTEAAIRGLPLKQRIAFTLRKLEDLEYDAIAETLECTPETARAHVFQALRKIRATLNGHALPRRMRFP